MGSNKKLSWVWSGNWRNTPSNMRWKRFIGCGKNGTRRERTSESLLPSNCLSERPDPRS